MAKKNIQLTNFNGDELYSGLGGFDELTGESGFSLQKYTELIVTNVMENVFRMMPYKAYFYLVHNDTTRNNVISQNNKYVNYNFGTSIPTLNQNNSIFTNVNWMEFIKTDDELDHYDAIRLNLENESFVTIRSTIYFQDSGGSGNDVYSRIKIVSSTGTEITDPTVGTNLQSDGKTTINVEASHKVSDGAIITLPIYGKTTNTAMRLFLGIELQEVYSGNMMMR